MKMVFGKTTFFIASVIMLCAGCDTTKKLNNKQKGAVIGAGSGAVIGGIIGNNVGNGKNTALGAIIGAAVGGVAGGIIGNNMDKQAEKIKEEIPGAEVTRVGEGINVTFNEKNPDGSKAGVYFATNMSDVNPNSRLALDKLVKVFNAYPETNILIEGHTDNVGEAAYNETLSQKRAVSVGNYLKAASIASSRLTIKWYGEMQPKTDNGTDAAKAENRRVEFAITANDKMKEDAAKEAANKN
ncbi:MAG: OmpA family protein [Chitinophagaceae bacterium]|nr:OmpA family protein [Chitinophagaceae bacterium]